MPWGEGTEQIAAGLEIYAPDGSLIASVDDKGRAVFTSIKVRPTRIQKIWRRITHRVEKK